MNVSDSDKGTPKIVVRDQNIDTKTSWILENFFEPNTSLEPNFVPEIPASSNIRHNHECLKPQNLPTMRLIP